MTLSELQRRVAAAIMVPLAPSTSIAKRLAPGRSMAAEAEELIKPNSRLTSVERLEIYSRSYWFRLLDSFAEDFPGLRAVVGRRAFDRLAKVYLQHQPSQSYTIRDLGSRLETWLTSNPEFTGKALPVALDMVRLEWAHIEAYDGAERKAIGPEDLLELGPDMKFAMQPHITLLKLQYPVDDLRIRVQELANSTGATSNMVSRRRERAAALRCRALQPSETFLAVHRLNFAVYYKRLAAAEFQILTALRGGATLGEALDQAAGDLSLIETWFTTWSRFGWFCAPERPTE